MLNNTNITPSDVARVFVIAETTTGFYAAYDAAPGIVSLPGGPVGCREVPGRSLTWADLAQEAYHNAWECGWTVRGVEPRPATVAWVNGEWVAWFRAASAEVARPGDSDPICPIPGIQVCEVTRDGLEEMEDDYGHYEAVDAAS